MNPDTSYPGRTTAGLELAAGTTLTASALSVGGPLTGVAASQEP